MRTANIQRDTKETRISGILKIEGRGRYDISTGIRFFDHMLELFTKHGDHGKGLVQGHQPCRLLRPAHGRDPCRGRRRSWRTPRPGL